MKDLKSKFPLGKKSRELEEDEDFLNESSAADRSDATGTIDVSDDEDAGTQGRYSLTQKFKTKIFGFKKENLDEGTDDPVDEFEDAPAPDNKKRNSRIIQAIVVLGIVVLIGQELLGPAEDEVAPPPIKPRRSRVVKKNPADVPPAVPADAGTGSESPETPAAGDATGTTATEIPADSTVTDIPADAPASDPAPQVAAPEAPTAETSTPDASAPVNTAPETTPPESLPTDVTTAPEPTSEPSITDAPAVEGPSTEPAPEVTASPEPTTPDPSIPDSTGANTSADSIDGQATTNSEDNLTEKMLKDLEKQAPAAQAPAEPVKEYVAPPDYEYRGRGLVYNCKGKHWACVDAPSYKICESNNSSTKFLGKAVECHPYNVYETQKGCETVQRSMVSSSYKTGFCAGN